ncbi:hypothetical protein SAMN05421740_107216 [Parapedobacter koreensis]|uniref:Uncharacterized protein n=1 Tax=Parapedobacter koreensis TaxID=332977 RepID=A0A1H7RNG3_9SPHI|nr:hypothetical protein SAMN05421740_107216 [Parapedobacter koreensis]
MAQLWEVFFIIRCGSTPGIGDIFYFYVGIIV